MNLLRYFLTDTSTSPPSSLERCHKILLSLVKQAYLQVNVAMIASTFCACIIYIGLYQSGNANTRLYIWAMIFAGITIARIALSISYKFSSQQENKILFWRNIYIIGSFLGGASWGLLAVYLFPHASPMQQTLIILMLAGVTAGAIPFAAAIPTAAIAFLLASITPFIVSLALINNKIYLLFDTALLLYLLYTITLTINTYKLIKNSIILQFENDALLNDLEINNKILEQVATHDPLTQVANRRLFEANFDKALQISKTNKTALALFYIDLDHFKETNDRYGHYAGDYILLVVIDRLNKYLKKEDIIARLGGDELAIIIENVPDQNHVEIIARTVCYLIALPIQMREITLNVSSSIGISIYPFDGQDKTTLIECADKCMYYAKKNGGNNYYFSDVVYKLKSELMVE